MPGKPVFLLLRVGQEHRVYRQFIDGPEQAFVYGGCYPQDFTCLVRHRCRQRHLRRKDHEIATDLCHWDCFFPADVFQPRSPRDTGKRPHGFFSALGSGTRPGEKYGIGDGGIVRQTGGIRPGQAGNEQRFRFGRDWSFCPESQGLGHNSGYLV